MSDEKRLVFLHTAASQVEVFEGLARGMGGGERFGVASLLDEGLLADVVARGGVDDDLQARVEGRVVEARERGADVVVCTCSSIGAAAELAGERLGVAVQRVDRAMAEVAVGTGERAVLMATLGSTFGASGGLLREVAAAAGVALELREVLVEGGAWERLLAGDREGYLALVAGAIGGVIDAGGVDVVVLAQASMAGAVEMVDTAGVPVLSSPELGVERVVETLLGSRPS